MKRSNWIIAFIALLAAPPASGAGLLRWEQLPPLPDKEGFASMFAGVTGGAMLAAGGANFPDKKPWEGGKKIWYDTVFVLEKPDGAWKVAGKLPRPLGYGVSVSHRAGVVCVGGSDADRHYGECFRLEWLDGKLRTSPLPPLPKPVANMCGALLGETLFVAGGTEKPDSTSALKTFYALDLAAKEPAWRELEPWPGPARMLAVAAALDGSFHLVSGADLSAGPEGKPVRTFLRDAYRFAPGKGWGRTKDLPRAVVAAPSPAPSWTEMHFVVLGGDDGSQVSKLQSEHTGFSKDVLLYDTRWEMWVPTEKVPAPRVTVPTVYWLGSWHVISGERRPGVRSPEVWSFPAR